MSRIVVGDIEEYSNTELAAKYKSTAGSQLEAPAEEVERCIAAIERDGFVIETGPDSILSEKTAAIELADAGHQVVLVEKAPSIGGIMAQLDKTYPTMDCSI